MEKSDWNLCAEHIHAYGTSSSKTELHLAKQHFFICDTLDYKESYRGFCKNKFVAVLSQVIMKFLPFLFGVGYNGSLGIISNVRQKQVSYRTSDVIYVFL